MKFNFFGGDPAKQFMEQHQKAAQLSNAGRYKEALPMHEKCLKIAAQGNLPLTEEELLTTWSNIATCHFQLDDYAAVLRYCRGTISLLEEWNAARQPGKNTGNELSKNKSVQDWKTLVPDGLQFAFRQSYDPLPILAYTYKTAGSASMYAKKFDQGLDYYKKALAVNKQLNRPNETAEIWTYIADEFRRQEAWDKTEKAARNALELARQGRSAEIQLNAGILLVHTYIALGTYIEALDILKWAITLAIKLQENAKAASLAGMFEWMSQKIRVTAEAALDTASLEALIDAKRALKERAEKDEQLLASIRKTLAERANTPRDNFLHSIPDVNDVFKQFAEKHCGPQAEGRWSTGAEEMENFKKTGYQGKTVGAMLYISRKPETFIRATLDADECMVIIMKEKLIAVPPDSFVTGYKGTKPQTIPARADTLLEFLEGFIRAGTLVEQDGRLVYVEPPEQK